MKNNKKIITVSIMVFLVIAANPIASGDSTDDEDDIVMIFMFSKPKIETINTFYDRVTIDGLPNTHDSGRPCLPFKPLKILLPQGKTVKNINVQAGESFVFCDNFDVEVAGYNCPLSKVSNSEIVNSVSNYDNAVFEEVGTYICRGFPILHLNLYPVRYEPETGELSYYNNMEVLVETEDSNVNSALRGLPEDYGLVSGIVDNPSVVDTYSEYDGESSFVEDYEYVIITSERFANYDGEYSFQTLVDSKKAKGVTAGIVTVEEIIGSPSLYGVNGIWGDNNQDNPFIKYIIYKNLDYFDDTSAMIRNFIRHAYMEWGTEYVLLAGDADKINSEDNIVPVRGLFANESGLPLMNGEWSEEEDDIPSDVYYACLDGSFNVDLDEHFGESKDRCTHHSKSDEADLYAEVYVGRACVDSEEEISNFVRKTLVYEQTGHEYLSEILFVGEYLGFEGLGRWGGNFNDAFIEKNLIPGSYNIAKFYDRDYPRNYWYPYEILDLINNLNPHIINHVGHGNHNYMLKNYDTTMTLLENDNYFFIYSHACLVGALDNYNCWDGFQESDCIAEVLTCEMSTGAFACVLNSRYGLASEDSVSAPSGYYDESFFRALFTENIHQLGPANHYSKEYYVNRIDENGMRWCYYETNLFGDPELSIKDANYAPDVPTVDGKKQGKAGIRYDFSVTTVDPDGDDVFYMIKLDEEDQDWRGPYHSGQTVNFYHIWQDQGDYDISVKAKDSKGAESDWSKHDVSMPKVKTGYMSLFEGFRFSFYRVVRLLEQVFSIF